MDEEYQNEDSNEFLDTQIELHDCQLCNRKFHPERIERHVQACTLAQVKQKERAKLINQKQKKKLEKQKELAAQDDVVTQSNWRAEHKKFQEVIQYNRKVKDMESKGEDPRTLKPPESTVNSNYVFCEHCQRNFAPHVADKHIPKCKDTIAKPKPPRKNTNTHMDEIITTKNQQIITSTTAPSQVERKPLIRKQFSDSSQQFRPQSLQKMMKTTDQLKGNGQGLPEVKNHNWTNIGFVNCQQRAMAIQDTQCPFCSRKFISKAAERHIPICEKLTQKQMLCVKRKSVPIKQNGFMVQQQQQLPQIKKSSNSVIKEIVNVGIQGGQSKGFCTTCGNKFQPTHKYCGCCGHKRGAEQVA